MRKCGGRILVSAFLQSRCFLNICLIVLNAIVADRAFYDMRDGVINVRADSEGRGYVCFIVISYVFHPMEAEESILYRRYIISITGTVYVLSSKICCNSKNGNASCAIWRVLQPPWGRRSQVLPRCCLLTIQIIIYEKDSCFHSERF
jgi:hypothetical protein